MEDINFPNTVNKVKDSFFTPFTSRIADLNKNIRLKGAEKQAVSLHNGLEKEAVSLRNEPEKQAVSLRNTNIIEFGTVTET